MPVDYNLGKIYKIVCNVTDEIYIGSTCQPTVAHRLAKHVQCYKRFKIGKSNYVTSYQIIEHGDYNIYLIENFPCNNKDELTKREGEIIKQMQNDFTVVNKNIPGRTYAEYYEQNKDKISEFNKQYYEQNTDIIKEHTKLYYEQNKDKIQDYQKEYYEQNKDKIQEYKKEYHKQNKDKTKEHRKEYYEQNKDKMNERKKERIQCDCGMTYSRTNKTQHCKTKKHIKLLEQLNNVA
jgi:hypothetical protein